MGNTKNIRKYYIIMVLIVLVISFTTACGKPTYVNRFTIKTSYSEWVKEIGLFSHRNINVQCYTENENELSLGIDYDKGLVGYKELCDIINAHNKFVDENPGYFPNDLEIYITNDAKSQKNISVFSNFANDDSYASELGVKCSAKLQYTIMDITDCTEVELNGCEDIQFDIPVVFLVFDYAPSEATLDFLCEFRKADKIVFTRMDESIDREETCKYIRAHLQNAEIYESIRDEKDGNYHLEKLD